ncbi:MAG: hypothetical protein Q7U42_10280, partial [Parvibaculum sp.]|nr:hypothetical protein [Parvibaculum sp.]
MPMKDEGKGEAAEPHDPDGEAMTAAMSPQERMRAFAEMLRLRMAGHFVSVRSKVVFLLTMVGAILVILSGAFTLYDFNHALRTQVEIRVSGAADVLTIAARRANSFAEMEPVLAAMTGAASVKDVAVAGADGRVVTTSNSGWLGKRVDMAALAGDGAGHTVELGRLEHLSGYGTYPGDYAIRLELPRLGTEAVAILRMDTDYLAGQLAM